MDAVFEGGGAGNPGRGGQVVRQPLEDYGIAPQWEVRPPGLDRPGGNQESRREFESFRDLDRRHLLQPQRTRHLTAPLPWWVLSLVGLAAAWANGFGRRRGRWLWPRSRWGW
jgi:hypothetical protein